MGHSLKDVQEILDAHYLGGRIQLAEQAIEKLDVRTGREQNSANRLQTVANRSTFVRKVLGAKCLLYSRDALVPAEGFEPPTTRLRSGCSTAELRRLNGRN